MTASSKYRSTLYAANIGYIVQAIVCNFAPLLFVTFQRSYGVTLSQLSLLVTLTFATQLISDIVMSQIFSRIGTRAGIVLANVCAATGLIALPLFAELWGFGGILAAVLIYSLGASIIEVLVSPIIEACPFERKAAIMSLLHSFYCWGSVLVVLGSTGLFLLLGVENWKWVSVIWAIVPIVDGILFCKVPLAELPCDVGGHRTPVGKLLKNPTMLLLFLLMIVSGAAELAVSQWASAFAEQGLGVSKATGDLLGPLSFAVLMGSGRLLYAFDRKLKLKKFMTWCCVLCIFGYLLIVLSPIPFLSLLGCGLVGFGVAVLWPGSLSIAASRIPWGGATMFALLACCGDIGCTVGPTTVGLISAAAGDNLKLGILAATVFPAVALCAITVLRRKKSALRASVES